MSTQVVEEIVSWLREIVENTKRENPFVGAPVLPNPHAALVGAGIADQIERRWGGGSSNVGL